LNLKQSRNKSFDFGFSNKGDDRPGTIGLGRGIKGKSKKMGINSIVELKFLLSST
jgi:hypothetical protein